MTPQLNAGSAKGLFQTSILGGRMHRIRSNSCILLFLAFELCWNAKADPVGTVFTYQGRLTQGVTNANGTYSFRFSCYDAATGGNQIAPAVTVSNILVIEGSFTANLD